jgi:hypothetical protein
VKYFVSERIVFDSRNFQAQGLEWVGCTQTAVMDWWVKQNKYRVVGTSCTE